MILIRIFNFMHIFITAQKFDTFTEAQEFYIIIIILIIMVKYIKELDRIIYIHIYAD